MARGGHRPVRQLQRISLLQLHEFIKSGLDLDAESPSRVGLVCLCMASVMGPRRRRRGSLSGNFAVSSRRHSSITRGVEEVQGQRSCVPNEEAVGKAPRTAGRDYLHELDCHTYNEWTNHVSYKRGRWGARSPARSAST